MKIKNRENRFCFYHPVTFIDHVKNNVLLEYNPYEGKTYKEVYAYEKFPIIKGEKNGNTYREDGHKVFNHEGVDFRGSIGTEIKSLIYGTVLAYGKYSTYGRTIFVCNRERTGVYLLAHLSEYNGDVLKKVEIIPGDVVGYVGTSGSADSSGDVDGRYPAHLHVSYFRIIKEIPENKIKSEIVKKTGDTIKKGESYYEMSERNPFYHESKKKPNEGGKK